MRILVVTRFTIDSS